MGAQAVRLSNIDIDNALKNKDFEVIFQPIFDLGNGALARVEAFVRWRHPSLGVLPPGAFISFFESQGRMSELTRYVLSQALTHYLDWRGPSAPGFSINLALSDLADEAFTSHFSVLLRDISFPADLITLECPMPPVTMPIPAAAEHFSRLASTGARLAIEVRGRANDFLRLIDPFPFDEIKTGGAAILRFARTVRGPGLSAISELIDIANNANAAITAVGVEDQASLAALRTLGFAAAQGNHLGRIGALSAFMPSRVNDVRKLLGLDPLSAEDLNALFRTEAPSLQQPEAEEPAAVPGAESENDQDALVERLEARLARRSDTAPVEETEAEAPAQTKPKHAAAKAAAIARAKRKAAQRVKTEPADEVTVDDSETAGESDDRCRDANAARSLQERLAAEFEAFAFAGEETSPPVTEPQPPETDDEFDIGFADEEFAQQATTDMPERDDNAVDETAEETGTEDAVEKPAESFETAEPITAAAGASGGSGLVRASLAVGRTGAYFRPGLRIGAAAPLSPPREHPAVPAAPEAVESTQGEEAEPFAAPETAEPESQAIAEGAGALADGRPRRKRKTNFLTRKYRIWPTHFWPRSLKRAWRRRQLASLQEQTEHESSAAE